MNKLLRFAILVGLIILSLVFYGAGSQTGVIMFFVIGLLFEGAFWFGLLQTDKTKVSKITSQ